MMLDALTMSIERELPSVCGICMHSKDDEFRSAHNAGVCWEEKPEDTNRPLKLTLGDEQAASCPSFTPDRELIKGKVTEAYNIDSKITSNFLRGTLPQNRWQFALWVTFYLSWADLDCISPYSKYRETELAEHMEINVGAPTENWIGLTESLNR